MKKPSISCAHTIGLFTKWTRPRDNVLDIGCGLAEMSYFLEKNGYAFIYNVDIGDFRQFETKHFQIFSGITLPFNDSNFDLVSFNFILHHIPNRNKLLLLKEAKRVTKRFLFILEDTPRNPLDKIISYRHGFNWRKKIDSKASFGFYSQRKWEELFKSLGLKIVISQKLGRFCRKKTQPFARSFFLLEKIE